MIGLAEKKTLEALDPSVETLFNNLARKIPAFGDRYDRHQRIGELVSALSQQERAVLTAEFERLLINMRQANASDIEIGGATSKEQIWLRIQGKKTPRPEFGFWALDQTDILCHNLISSTQRNRLMENRAIDFSYSIRHPNGVWRWRASMYFDLGHLALNLRAIAGEIYPYQKLGFHSNITLRFSLKHEKQGLVLVTGITGSGKSTTLDSIIDANNRSTNGHIVIIGDPIEFIHSSHMCIVRHREVGMDVLSFKDGAIQALRQDPDIIVVGEMRDPDTIMTCLEIVDTGHKVFSTLHTGSTVETIDRIVAESPTDEQERVRNRLADVLRVVVSQKLLPGVNGMLVLAKEVLLVNSAVKAAIRNKNTHEIYQMISENGKEGMITLEQDLLRLLYDRLIDERTALDYSNNRKRLKELLQK